MTHKSAKLQGLYAITPGTMTQTDTLIAQVATAIEAGVRLLQYRNKSQNDALRLEQACALQQLCARHEVALFINDDVALAKTCGAAGVHLGQGDMSIQKARTLLGEQAIIGVTCHDRLDLAHHAVQQGADLISFGRFFDSATKPDAPTADLAILQQAKQQLPVPIAAIGGIEQHSIRQVSQAGADVIAVCAAIFAAPCIAQAVAQLQAQLPEHS